MGNIQIQGNVTGKEVLPEAIVALKGNLEAKFFWVVFAGYAENLSRYQVQINISGTNEGFSSEWPEWAYLLAKEAMMYNRRLCVIYKDIPWGDNIAQVYIMHENG